MKGDKQFGLVPVDSVEQVRINQANRDQLDPAMRARLDADSSDAKLSQYFTCGGH